MAWALRVVALLFFLTCFVSGQDEEFSLDVNDLEAEDKLNLEVRDLGELETPLLEAEEAEDGPNAWRSSGLWRREVEGDLELMQEEAEKKPDRPDDDNPKTRNFIEEARHLIDLFRQGRGTSKLTAAQQKETLDEHNQYRAKQGASDMNKLTWNDNIASKAQELADTCEFKHALLKWKPSPYPKGVGQNIYAWTGDFSVKAGVKAWYDEIKDYTYSSDKCKPGKACGHYTQVVWAKSKEIGCGGKRCAKLKGSGWSLKNAYYYVCNYGPSGNWFGQKPFQKGGACSKCPSDRKKCENKLCA